MFKMITLLTLLIRHPPDIATLRACTPNTQFIFNGRLCFCDNRGKLNEANCRTIRRRQTCQPGQIIWHGCNQCICQEKGYSLCSNSHCPDDVKTPVLRQSLSIFGQRCTPFKSYYINCSICVCPASGITNEAQCVNDISCNSQISRIDLGNTNKIHCIPNVMYLTQCKQCLCPENGYFDTGSCIEKCKYPPLINSPPRTCIPETFYKIDCNICRCPSTGIANDSLCISAICHNLSLDDLKTDTKRCIPHSFTIPRCVYCECNTKGVVNENACLEMDCAKTNLLGKHSNGVATCHPGEMVPICTECFCTRDGQAVAKYCSRLCSYQNRLNILETVLKDASDFDVIEKSQVNSVRENGLCTPNTLYLDDGRYCLCPENGDTSLKFCTSVTEEPKPLENQDVLSNNIEVDYNTPCEPNTFVEFDCNTCYCAKNGKIDPNWCTYDDCRAKRLIQESHKTQIPVIETAISGTCKPGAILKLKCNFCICPDNGVLIEKACTQNDCTEFDQSTSNDKLMCEPLAYYEVDCNICYCPRDGIKNVAKCTKKQCEKNSLRSESCIPGQLFSDVCNLCVCPSDGNKEGKACTNHVCPEVVPENLQLSEDLINSHVTFKYSKSLDHCFPGEEFVDGCNLCICPELGLKVYAICEAILCDDKSRNGEYETTPNTIDKTKNSTSIRSRRNTRDCYTYNVSLSAERKECTPGTTYIIRCKECICPYLGNINNFCRPLANNMHCEQAFPYFNYLPMGRRQIKGETAKPNVMKDISVTNGTGNMNVKIKENVEVKVKHDKHTEYECEAPGKIIDKCFICDCEKGKSVIEEHCFKSDAVDCSNAKPTFFFKDKVYL